MEGLPRAYFEMADVDGRTAARWRRVCKAWRHHVDRVHHLRHRISVHHCEAEYPPTGGSESTRERAALLLDQMVLKFSGLWFVDLLRLKGFHLNIQSGPVALESLLIAFGLPAGHCVWRGRNKNGSIVYFAVGFNGPPDDEFLPDVRRLERDVFSAMGVPFTWTLYTRISNPHQMTFRCVVGSDN